MSHSHNAAIRYRPEVDGLRALAVLPVIFFHAGFRAFSGGFVGVDIFFVISGYLISLILLKDLETGRFSIARFYERRARRIMPALVVVTISCLPFAWNWMLPDELRRFGQSLMAVGTFASNIFFWHTTGYFSPSAEEQPLLHTWSLAVEEQYYLLFPIFLAVCWRMGKSNIARLVIVLALSSLALSEWGWRHQATANFYLLPFRAWELLAGVLTAFWQVRAPTAPGAGLRARAAAWAPWLGLGLIAYSISEFDKNTPCPSLYALAPVLGAVLVIAFGTAESGVGRVLAAKPFVFVGAISYSAYLWHQPILAFARLNGFDDGGLLRHLVLVAATLPLSYLSWRFVEQPFRRPDALSRQVVLTTSAIALVACCAVGGVIWLEHGFRNRSLLTGNDKVQEYLAVQAQIQSWGHWCEEHRTASTFRSPICRVGAANAEPEIILWGDSLAGALTPGLDAELKRSGRSSLVFEADGCPPLPGLSIVGSSACKGDIHGDFVRYLGTLPRIKYVIWYGNVQGAMQNDEIRLHGAATSVASAMQIVRETLEQLKQQGKRVMFVEQGPLMPGSVPDFYVRDELRHGHQELEVSREAYLKFVQPVSQMRSMVDASGQFLVTEELYCDAVRCPARRTEYGLIYSDNMHVSLPMAKALAAMILTQLNP